jgi:glyoxylase-like metal-dependent hydrolase (beta-lactamase superfamily II)
MGDHFVLVEAPLSPEYANLQKGILATLKPGKPVRFVLVTHHHGDHTGGLLAWAQAGATIIVPSGAKVAIERQLEARGFTGTARIEEVESRRSFGTGAARTDAYAFSTAHSEAHLIVHVPQSGILFQGDLFYLPERGDVPPAFPVVGDLQRQIDRLGLRVEQVVGVHGRPATLEQVRESLRSRELRPET